MIQMSPYLQARERLLQEFERWSTSAAGAAALMADEGEGDELDAGEAFDRMEAQRIAETAPESGAYHAALKKTIAAAAMGGTGRGQRARAH